MLGWKDGQELPKWMTTVSWVDGNIPQLQTMMLESCETLDLVLNIIHNKHAASATGT